MGKGRAKSKKAKKAAAAKAAGSFAVAQRVKVIDAKCWAAGYLGSVVGDGDGGAVIVQLDVKGVSHQFKPAQLAAL